MNGIDWSGRSQVDESADVTQVGGAPGGTEDVDAEGAAPVDATGTSGGEPALSSRRSSLSRHALGDDPPESSPPWSWHLQRALVLVLVVVVPAHLLSTVLLVDHASVDVPAAAQRWETVTWRLVDWLVVVCGALHGALATESLARRSGAGRSSRALAVGAWALCGALVCVSTAVVFTYDVP